MYYYEESIEDIKDETYQMIDKYLEVDKSYSN